VNADGLDRSPAFVSQRMTATLAPSPACVHAERRRGERHQQFVASGDPESSPLYSFRPGQATSGFAGNERVAPAHDDAG